jgi:hypothetical protein
LLSVIVIVCARSHDVGDPPVARCDMTLIQLDQIDAAASSLGEDADPIRVSVTAERARALCRRTARRGIRPNFGEYLNVTDLCYKGQESEPTFFVSCARQPETGLGSPWIH